MPFWLVAGMVGTWSAYARDHAAPEGYYHARVFRQALSVEGPRIASAAIIFVFLIPYTASVYNGLSRLFGMAFGLPYEWCVVGMRLLPAFMWCSVAIWPPC